MTRRSNFAYVFVLTPLLLLACPASADQDPGEATQHPAVSEQDKALQQVRDELDDTGYRWYAITRLKWGFPLRFSAGFGAMLVEQPRDADCATGCGVRGWHFEVEPGQYGIQGSIGWGKLVGETGRTKRWFHTVNWGWAIRGSVLRTWRYGPMGPIDQSLVGVEGSLSIARFNMSAGLMRSLTSATDDDWVFIGAVGIGY